MIGEGGIAGEKLKELSVNRAVADTICPLCSHKRKPQNRKLKVLRIWNDGRGFYTFNCEHCGEAGWAKEDQGGSRQKTRPLVQPVAVEPDKSEIARFLWKRSMPADGTLVETYLRSRSCWTSSPSLRFLPGRDEHPPAMIARFEIKDDDKFGVHLTKLKADGSGKAGTDKDKIMIGPSKGWPIVIADNPESAMLATCEGIEDGASLALALPGWTIWAAGAAGRIATLMDRARGFERVVIAHDVDEAGRKALHGYTRQDGTFIPGVLTKRSDVVVLDFGMLLRRGRPDANQIVRNDGIKALTGVVEFALMKDSIRRGRAMHSEEIVRRAVGCNGIGI